MAGGVFTNQPFHPNPKCIAISLFFGIGYLLAPCKNWVVFIFILFTVYIAVSWYDYLYACQQKMMSGNSGLHPQTLFKPQYRDSNEIKLVADQERMYLKTVYLFHVLLISPLLLYCGYVGYTALKPSGEFKSNIFAILGGLGSIALLYHGGRLFYPRQITPTIYVP
jgi:hypothetical protein